MNYVSTRPSRRQTGGKSLSNPRQRPVCAEYTAVQLFVVVGLRAPTTDALHVAGAVSLAWCWRWQNVVAAAFLHWLVSWLQLPVCIFDGKQLWDFEMDAIIIISTDRYVGEISRLLRRSRWGGHVPIWRRSRRMIRCENVSQKSK